MRSAVLLLVLIIVASCASNHSIPVQVQNTTVNRTQENITVVNISETSKENTTALSNANESPKNVSSETTANSTPEYHYDVIEYAREGIFGLNGHVLCAVDHDHALAWDDIANEQGTVKGELVNQSETEIYFEFEHFHNKYPPASYDYLFRVEKCNYLNRSQSDVEFMGRYNYTVGHFNVRPITMNNARRVAEYLWHTNWDRIVNHSEPILHESESQNDYRFAISNTELIGFDFGDSYNETKCGIFSLNKRSGLVTYTHIEDATEEKCIKAGLTLPD